MSSTLIEVADELGKQGRLLGLPRSAWFAGAGAATIVLALVIDRVLWGLPVNSDRAADLSWRGAARVLPMAIAVGCFVAAMLAWAREHNPRTPRLDIDLWPDSAGLRAGLAAIFVGGAFCALLLLASPVLFHEGALEDGIAEWLSAALLFLSSISCALLAWRLRRADGRGGVVALAIALLAVAHFILAGEEVSWLQRVLDIKTPDAFRGNAQQELNFHNFSTRWAEIGFYVGAGFVLPVLIPVWLHLGLPLGPLRVLTPLAPSAYLLGPAAVVAAYNVNRWNWLPTQLPFWGCVVLLGAVAAGASGRAARMHAVLILCLMAFIQIAFLAAGPKSLRGWDVTEYKELFIAALLFLYCLALWRPQGER